MLNYPLSIHVEGVRGMASLKYWLWLTTRPGLQNRDSFRLLEHFGSPEAAFFADPAEYALAGLSGQRLAGLLDKSLEGAERILADCDRLGLRVFTLRDAAYPERLAQIDDPPCVLYARGRELAVDELVSVGVVGSRRPSPYGVELAGRLGLELARRGALVVSGIAQGIDAAALRGALRGGGSVLSVLGCGADVVYPRENRWLYEDVAAAGALITEYPPGTPAEGWHFPIRNRILSGLSLGVVAVEAAERSGTLVTARLALEQNRDVFAFPGPVGAPMSLGTNRLIQRGEAKLVLGAADVLCEYEDVYPGRLTRPDPLTEEETRQRLSEPPVPAPAEEKREETVDKTPKRAYITLKDYAGEMTDDEREILLALGEASMHADALVERTQIPARRVLSALTMLQVRGWVDEGPGKRFTTAVLIKE